MADIFDLFKKADPNVDVQDLEKNLDPNVASRIELTWKDSKSKDQFQRLAEMTGLDKKGLQNDRSLATALQTLVDNFAKKNIVATPKWDKSTRTVTMELRPVGSPQLTPAKIQFAIADQTGMKNIAGRTVRDTWQTGYTVDKNGNLKLSLTGGTAYAMQQLAQSVASSSKTSINQAIMAKDMAALERAMKRYQRDLEKQITVQSKREQKEINEALAKISLSTKDPKALLRESGMLQLAPIFKAIARNPDGIFGRKMKSSMKGKTYNQRVEIARNDVNEMLSMYAVSPKNARENAKRRFGKTYGDGLEAILSLVEQLNSIGVEVTNVSNGSYAGGHVGTLTTNQISGDIAVRSDVHAKQVLNHHTRKINENRRKAIERITMKAAYRTKAEQGMGAGQLDRADEERLLRYVEVSRQNFEKGRRLARNHLFDTLVQEKQKQLKNGKNPALSEKQKAEMRRDFNARYGDLGTINEDSYAMTKAAMFFLDSDDPKNMTITKKEIDDRRAAIMKARKGAQVSDEDAIRDVIAGRLKKSQSYKGYGRKKLRKMIGHIVRDDNSLTQRQVGNQTYESYNYTYDVLQKFMQGGKSLWGSGDRATSIKAQELELLFAAMLEGVDIRKIANVNLTDKSFADISKVIGRYKAGNASEKELEAIAAIVAGGYEAGSLNIGAARTKRDLSARGFAGWFDPRRESLFAHAAQTGRSKELVSAYNSIIKSAIGEEAYKKIFQTGDYVSLGEDKASVVRNFGGGFTDLLDLAYGNKQKAKQEAFKRIMVGADGKGGIGSLFERFGLVSGGNILKLMKDDNGNEILGINDAIDSQLVLASAANAIAKTPYGAPSVRGAVHWDKRARYAERRGLAAAAADAKGGHDFGLYRDILTREEANTEISAEEWEALKEEQKELFGKMSLRAGAAAARGRGATVFSSKDFAGDEYELLGEAYLNSKIPVEDFKKTVFGKLWEKALEYKKSKGSYAGLEMGVDLGRTFSFVDPITGRSTSGDYVPIPTSMFERLGTMKENGIEYMSGLPSYLNELTKILRFSYENGIAGQAGDAWMEEAFNDNIQEYREKMFDEIYGKDGAIYKAANRATMGRSGYMPINAPNFENIGNLNDEMRKRLAETDAVVGIGVLGSLLGSPQKKGNPIEELKDFRDDLFVNYERIFADANDTVKQEVDDYFKQQIGTNDFKKRIEESGNKSGEELKKELSAQINVLQAVVKRGVTLEDTWFQAGKGLYSKIFRNPLTFGEDIKHIKLYASRSDNFAGHNMFLGAGTGWGPNADWDGDQIALMLPFAGGATQGLSPEERKKLYASEEVLNQRQARISEYIAKKFKENNEDTTGDRGMKLKDLETLVDSKGQTIAEWAAKRNFAMTGILDNFRQRFAYNAAEAGVDELSKGAGDSLSTIITRTIFESISQDAISAKKVLDRYRSRGVRGSDADIYETFFGELQQLSDDIFESDKYFDNPKNFTPFLEKLEEMGILDKNTGLAERYSAELFGKLGAGESGRRAYVTKYLGRLMGLKGDEDATALFNKDAFDVDKTSIEEFEQAVKDVYRKRMSTPEGEKELESLFGMKVLKWAMTDTESMLAEALGKNPTLAKDFYGKSKTWVGKLLTSARYMPGHEDGPLRAPISAENAEFRRAEMTGDAMQDAANTLLKAAEALLKLAEGGGSGGGFGRGGNKAVVPNGSTAEENLNKLSGAMAAGVKPMSVSNLIERVHPYGLGTDYSGYIKALLSGSIDSYGPAEKQHLLAEMGTPMQGNLGGILKIMWQYGLQSGMFNPGDAGKIFKDPSQFEKAFADLHGNKKKNAAMYKYAFGEAEEMLDVAKKLGIQGLPTKDSLSTVEGNLQLYNAIMNAPMGTRKKDLENNEELKQLQMQMGRANTGMLGYSIYNTALRKAQNVVAATGGGGTDYLGELYGGEAGGRLQKQIALTEAFAQSRGLQYLGGEQAVAAKAGDKYLHGSLDNLYFDPKTGTMYIIDDKNPNSNVSATNVAQQMVYKYIVENMRSIIQNQYSDKDGYKRFLRENPELAKEWGMGKAGGKEVFDAFQQTKSIETYLASVNRSGQARMVQVGGNRGEVQNVVSKLLDMYDNYEVGSPAFQDLLLKQGHILTGEGEYSGDTLLSESLRGRFKDLGSEYRRYVAEQTRNNQQIEANKFEMSLETDSERIEKLQTANDLLQKQNEALQININKWNERAKEAGHSEKDIEDFKKEVNGEMDLLKALGEVDLANRKKKMGAKLEREYKRAWGGYNQAMITYEGDAISMNKTNNALEKRALQARMEDTKEQIDYYEGSIKDLESKMKAAGVDPQDIANLKQKGLDRFQLMEDTLKVRNKGITNLWESLGASFKMMITRFTQMGLAYSILNKVKKAFSEVTQSAAQLNKVMTGLRIVTGDSYEDAHQLMAGYADLASQLAATTIEVATAGQEWLRQGYDIAKVNDLITSSIQLSTLGMMSSADATKALTSAMKGFKMEASQASDIVDKFTTLDMRAATTAGDIATALSKFATTAQMAGLNIDQASAMATTIMDISQSDAGATGNALKTILSRYGNVKAGTFQSMSSGDSDDTTDKINDIERVLNTLGIQVRTSAREMRDFDDVLADIAEKWDYLDKVSQNAIATALAGTRQREAFAVLMNNYDRYQELLKVSQDSEGMAAKKYQSYLESLEASQKRLKAAWEDFANESGIAEFLTNLNNMIAPFVKDWLPAIIKYVSKLIFTLNSYKYPKILAGLFAPSKGMIGGIFGGLTSAGLQQKASQYSLKGSFDFVFKGLSGASGKASSSLDTLANAALKAAGALNGSKAEGGKAQGGGGKRPSGLVDANGNPIYVESAPSAGAAGVDASAPAQTSGASGEYLALPYYRSDPNADFTDYDASTGQFMYTGKNARNRAWKKKRAELKKQRQKAAKQYRQERNKEWFSPSAEGAMMGAAYAAASIAEGVSIGQQGMNYTNGQMQKASNGANAAATINSVGSAVGYIWGPVVGTLTTTAADLLNKFLIIPLFDWQENEKKAREELLSKVSEQLNALDNPFSKLSSISKLSELSGEQYKEMNDTINDFLKNVYAKENAGMKRALTDKLMELIGGQKIGNREITSVKDITDAYLEGSQKDRELIINLLMASQTIAKARTDYSLAKSQMGNTDFIIKVAPFSVDHFTGKGHGKDVLNILSRNGMEFDQTVRGAGGSGEYKSTGTLEDNILALEKALNNLTEEEERYRGVLSDYLADLKNQQTQIESIRKEYNVALAKAGILTAQNAYGDALLSTSNRSLKNMGIEEIKKIIAKEIKEEGGLVGHDLYDPNGELTQYAEEVISQVIRENPLLNGILTGSSYTLRDLLVMKSGKTEDELRKDELVASFASALNIGVEEFIEKMKDGTLLDEYGNLSLGALTKTAEETRSTISALCSVMDELNSATGLTAEGLETLLSQFPELVKYVGDEGSLNAAIINNLEDYKKDYARKTYRSIMSNEGVFEQFDYDLSQNEYMQQLVDDGNGKLVSRYELLSRGEYGNASTLEDIKKMLWGNPEDYGLTAEEQEVLRKQYAEIFDNIDTDKIVDQKIAQTMSSYLKKANEREIKALEEQKQALQDINKQREYENKLIEARNRLEEAGKEKKRVWREGVGWVYESDQEALKEAQKNLEEVENEKNIRELELQIEQLQAWNEALDKVFDDSEFENLKKSYDAWAESNGLIATSMHTLIMEIAGLQNGTGAENSNVHQTAFEDAPAASAEQIAKAEEAGGRLDREYDAVLKAEAAMEAAAREHGKNSEEYQRKKKEYYEALKTYQTTADEAEGSTAAKNFYEAEGHEDAAGYRQKSLPEDELGWVFMNLAHVHGTSSTNYRGNFRKGVLLDSNDDTYAYIQKAFKGQDDFVGYYYDPDNYNYSQGDKNSGIITGLGQPQPIDSRKFANVYDGSLSSWIMAKGKNGMILSGGNYKGVVWNKELYYLQAAARGSLGLPGGPTLLNEMGTEAVVTPYGTVTSLPSGSGVVPADVTKNLWALGDVAPGLLRLLEIARPTLASGSTDNHSLSVGVINMDVHADKDFDVDTWVSQLRNAAYLKKNS